MWAGTSPDQALREAGPAGLDTGEMAAAVTASGVRAWEQERIAKSSCASTCIHDPAFARVEKGRFALRVLRPDLEVTRFGFFYGVLMDSVSVPS